MQIRDYQEKHIKQVVEAIEQYRTVVAQLPTGGGKTVEFSRIIKMLLNKNLDIEHGPALILVHRQELMYQAESAVKRILNIEPCLITSETSRFWISRCYIGMVESTMSRLHMILNPSLIIIDECHLQNFTKVHNYFKYSKIIGFSATPISVSKKDPLKNHYKKIVTGPSIKELINQEYLAQNITRAPKTSIDSSQFQFDRLKNDYNERQMASVYSMSSNIENCLNKYYEFCANKKTLIFNVNIEHSRLVNEMFQFFGLPSKHLDASCKDREDIFKWFKETPNAILNSVMIPTMGFDEPTVDSVILNYSTTSLVKFIQTCGRGSRIIDDWFIENMQTLYPYPLKRKKYFDIIDLGQNWTRFGDWNDERDWARMFYFPDAPSEGIAPVKTCPKCEGLIHAAARVCTLYKPDGNMCGYEFQKRSYKQIDMEEMILVTKGIDIQSLVDKTDKKYKYYPFFEMAVDIVNNMIAVHGHNPSQNIINRHFRIYYELCIEWYDKTLGTNPEEIGDIRNSMWHILKAKNNFNSLLKKNGVFSTSIKDEDCSLIVKEDEDFIKKLDKNWESFKAANF